MPRQRSRTCEIFHAGTKADGDRITANGGRVLGVAATGKLGARGAGRAYAAVDKIDWPGGFCRRDIGYLAIAREQSGAIAALAITAKPARLRPGEPHDQHRPPGGLYRHQGRGGAAALRRRAAGGLSRARTRRASPGPLTVQQFKGGQSNPTYLLETPARKYVLRRKPPGKLLPSAHAVDREFRVISALHAQGFPVAEPVIYCADESVTGTAFYVMGFVEGRVFWDAGHAGLQPGRAHGGLSTR